MGVTIRIAEIVLVLVLVVVLERREYEDDDEDDGAKKKTPAGYPAGVFDQVSDLRLIG